MSEVARLNGNVLQAAELKWRSGPTSPVTQDTRYRALATQLRLAPATSSPLQPSGGAHPTEPRARVRASMRGTSVRCLPACQSRPAAAPCPRAAAAAAHCPRTEPGRPDPGGMASAAATIAVAGAALRLANPCGISGVAKPVAQQDRRSAPPTGVIGFKSTGSATRHTSTQDRPASDVSLLYYDRHNDLSAESRHDRPCHACRSIGHHRPVRDHPNHSVDAAAETRPGAERADQKIAAARPSQP
jgi:hypothetical protein